MGVDISMGNNKGGHGSTFRKRFSKFRRRHARIRRLGRAGGPASRVLKTGICPSVLYPASVYGVSDKMLAKVLTLFATACGHWRAGASATLVLATAPLRMLDPIYQASLAPILEVSKRVFSGSLSFLQLFETTKYYLGKFSNSTDLWDDVEVPIGAAFL
jgi:hypothetical protein